MKKLLFWIAAISALLTSRAGAQPSGSPDGWSLSVGAGGLLTPAYKGDDDYRLLLLPNIQVAYGDRFFASVQDGVGYNVINRENLRVGPIARIEFSRDEDGSQPFAIAGERSDDLIGLGDVGTTIELGGFAEFDVGPLTASLEARQAVNGHDGFVADVGLRYGGRTFAVGPPVIYSFGPRLKIVDDNFTGAYFSVTPGQSLASGLPVFDADGGLYSVGAGATFILPLSRDNRMSAVLIAGYDHLTGDAGDAPLVELRGARDQASVGLFFSYRLF